METNTRTFLFMGFVIFTVALIGLVSAGNSYGSHGNVKARFQSACGNGVCNPFETFLTCPEDCGYVDIFSCIVDNNCNSESQCIQNCYNFFCGNGICNYWEGFCEFVPSQFDRCNSDCGECLPDCTAITNPTQCRSDCCFISVCYDTPACPINYCNDDGECSTEYGETVETCSGDCTMNCNYNSICEMGYPDGENPEYCTDCT